VIKGYGSVESERSASRALELCRLPGADWKNLWFAFRGRSLSVIGRADLHKAHELTAEMVALAEQHASASHLAQALEIRGLANLMAGAFESAAADFDRAIAISESTPTPGQERLWDGPFMNRATARAQYQPGTSVVWGIWIRRWSESNRLLLSLTNQIQGVPSSWSIPWP
jgi:hypothetical protein